MIISKSPLSVPDCVSSTMTITAPKIDYDQMYTLLGGDRRPQGYSVKINAKPLSEVFEPKDIIRNGPATIVFWKDGTKTIVKLKEGMPDDPYSAFCAALAKKIFKSGSKIKKISAMARLELPKELTK